MNVLFGVATASAPLLLIAYLVAARAMRLKTGLGLSGAYLCLALFYSFQTYGPRVEVASPQTYSPPRGEVAESPALFTKERTRVGQFDERLEKEAPEE